MGEHGLTVAAVAAATGYSVQQIRDLERLGVLAAADRAGNGYRHFGPDHLRDLRAYRDLARAVGPVAARGAMRAIRSLPCDEAAALVCALPARLQREREQALAARAALLAIEDESAAEAEPAANDTMTITELAGALGLRASTLRFWEQEGLLTPERTVTRSGSARRYPPPAVRDARIATALRAAGYGIPEVREALTAVRELHDAGHSLTALEERVRTIARRELALLRAAAILAEIIEAAS
ncbi:MerR family transcriptional regulator [Nocardia sp. NPDC048505]|uniref:MerR family transcriptional regulator n=1 Tax=unclassified Nocardia TaxID=2637762 RepID=UPI0033ECF649